MEPFADRLAAAVIERRAPVVVGLDPRVESLPSAFQPGRALEEQAAAVEAFCRGVVDVVAPLAPAVKPQAAFFERLGPAGMTALARVIAWAVERDLLVILDGKRNDIGSTAAAYARAYLGRGGESVWGADALTVNPYLGDDSLRPFVEAAQERGAGVFVLVKTSNPGGALFQDLEVERRPLYWRVAEHVERLAEETATACGYGAVGAVAGATYPEQLAQLRAAMPHSWFLVPGFGAQGAGATDVAGAFDSHGLGAIVNSSRGIIFAHRRPEFRDRYGGARWQEAVEQATRQMIEQLRTETPAGRLPPS